MCENLPPQVAMRLMREIRKLTKTPPEGIQVHVNEGDLTNIQADILGPADTPFEGGVFRIQLVLGHDFPNSPPKGFFQTKIFHPNISSHGEICVNTLKRDWKPSHGIEHILVIVRCLLIYPNPESALNPAAGKLLLENFDAFAKRARMHTQIHAVPKKEVASPCKVAKAVVAAEAPAPKVVAVSSPEPAKKKRKRGRARKRL